MKFILNFFLITTLIGCGGISRDDEEEIQKNVDITVEVVKPQVLKVVLHPEFPLPGRIYSVTFLHADASVTFPLPKPTQQDKDGVIMLALEETDDTRLTSPFYKKGLMFGGQTQEKTFENPFQDRPMKDANGLPVGSEATGILYLMTKSVGQGVQLTPQGEGKIDFNDQGEYEFFIHFNTQIPEWKILIGVVHVDIFNPYLENPTLTPIFNLLKDIKKG